MTNTQTIQHPETKHSETIFYDKKINRKIWVCQNYYRIYDLNGNRLNPKVENLYTRIVNLSNFHNKDELMDCIFTIYDHVKNQNSYTIDKDFLKNTIKNLAKKHGENYNQYVYVYSLLYLLMNEQKREDKPLNYKLTIYCTHKLLYENKTPNEMANWCNFKSDHLKNLSPKEREKYMTNVTTKVNNTLRILERTFGKQRKDE
ncbi:DUF7004 family protein [Lactobacillaceae bacterium Scapto_B20]